MNFSPSKKNHQLTIINWGKGLTWLFLVLLIVTAFVLLKQNELLKNRNIVINSIQSLLIEQSRFHDTLTRYHIQNIRDFDLLTRHQQQIERHLHNIERHILQDKQINKELVMLQNSIGDQKQLMHDYKPILTSLQNTQRFFPSLAEECSHTLTNPNHRRQLQKIMFSKLIQQGALTKDPSNFQRHISSLKTQLPEGNCVLLFQQADLLIQTHQKKQTQLFQELSRLPIYNNIQHLSNTVENSTGKLVQTNQLYNAILLFTSFLFLGFITLALYRLTQTNNRLNHTLTLLDEQKNMYRALSEANQVVANLNDEQEIYQAITEIITKYINIPSCWVGQKYPDSNLVRPVAISGLGKEVIQQSKVSIDPNQPEGRGGVGEVYRTQKPVIINHYLNSEKTTPWYETAKNWGIQGLAAFPICNRNQVQAAVVFYSLEKTFFTEEKVTIIEELIRDVGLALERIQLLKEQREHQKAQALAAIAFESQESIIITKPNSRIVKTNQAFTQISGYSSEEVAGQTPAILKSNLHDKTFYKKLWQTLIKEGRWQGEMWNRKKDGSFYAIYQTITAVHDDNGRVTNYVSHGIDMTQNKEAEHKIAYMRNHDGLTDLSNRHLLLEYLQQFINQGSSTTYVLILVNINRFKTYNETLGNAAGDTILIEAATRLKQINMEHNFHVSRVGADEFTILSSLAENETNDFSHQTNQIFHAIEKQLRAPLDVLNETIHLDLSMGVTLFDSQAEQSPEEILQQAHIALARAKQNPKTHIEYYQEAMQQQAISQMNLEKSLAQALENEEFILHYQPQIQIETGDVIGVETLIRWQKSGEDQLVPPGEFIQTLEDSDLIIPVGRWLIEKAITDFKPQQAQFKHPVQIAINLSGIQFNDPGLADFIQEMLTVNQFSPDCLELEVTESVLMNNVADVRETLTELESQGIKIAIDDFGTGYSSLAYLKQFPVSKLKIDKSFVDDMHKPKDFAIIKTIIEMAKTMTLASIAEGVETEEQKNLLQNLNCDEIQGYYYSKPLPFDEAIAYIKANHQGE